MGRLAFLFLFHLFLLCPASSWDFGVFGETFEISERDLLEQIFSKLRELQEAGRLEAEQKKVTERVKEMILHPQPIPGITHTQTRREYKFDPTITVTRDLSDHRGRNVGDVRYGSDVHFFAKKGEMFNPLDKINMTKPLLFIDGDDEKHVKWAISKLNKNNLCKVILVKGAPLDLQKQLNRDIYLDQNGLLTTKLGIKHVPAIVFQKYVEKVLTIIEEMPVPEVMEKQ